MRKDVHGVRGDRCVWKIFGYLVDLGDSENPAGCGIEYNGLTGGGIAGSGVAGLSMTMRRESSHRGRCTLEIVDE